MKIEKTDRRVQFTTALLKDSLIKLMQTNHISKISVKMLCESADINRSTFYAHFKDPIDLLTRLESEVISTFREQIDITVMSEQSEMTVLRLKQVLDYVAENAPLFKVLLSDNSETAFFSDIMAFVQQKTIDRLRRDQRLAMRTSEYLQLFVITGALRILQKWLEDGMVESTGEMAELISRLLFQGVSAFQ